MVTTMVRLSATSKHRLKACRRWESFRNATANNPTMIDLWSVLSSYEAEAENVPGARALVKSLAGLPKIGLLRQACAGDPVLAAAVTMSLEQFAHDLNRELEKVLPPGGRSSGTGDDDTEGDGDNENQEGSSGGGNGEDQDDSLDTEVEAAVHRVAWHLNPEGVQDRVRATERGYSLLGDGLTLQERVKVLETDLTKLEKILKMVGVMRQVTTETVRTIRDEAPMVTLPKPGYRGGMSALTMLQPTEVADISSGGVLESLFWKRWKNGRAKVTRTQARIPAAAGPMVVLGDESWSMQAEVQFTGIKGAKAIEWLMALVLATADQCEAQGRPFLYRGWSSHVEPHRRFEKMTVENRLELISNPLNDGTNLVAAIQVGLMELEKMSTKRQRGDLLVITDGSWFINESYRNVFRQKLHDMHSRAHLLLVEQSGKTPPESGPDQLWESVTFVEDLLESSMAVGKALA